MLSGLSDAEKLLDQLKIGYIKEAGGMIIVQGDLDISRKGLSKLPDLSGVIVKGSFSCAYNELTTLEGSPAQVGREFWCHDNHLVSIEGAPHAVGGLFNCSNNKNLTTLKGGPSKTGGGLFCKNCGLLSLEYAPQVCSRLLTDFGDFSLWEIPEHLRVTPETKKQAQERLQKSTWIKAGMPIKNDIKVQKPIRLKKRF